MNAALQPANAVMPPVIPKEMAQADGDIRVLYPRVLSAEAGNYKLNDPRARELMCLLSNRDGTSAVLLISATHMRDSVVSSVAEYRQLLQLHGLKFKMINSTDSEIADHYKAGDSQDSESLASSSQQETVLRYIRNAAKQNASDVKFQIGGEWCRVRYKVHGRSKTAHEIKSSEGYQLVRAMFNTMTEQGSGQGNLNESTMQDGQLRADYAVACGLAGSRIATRPAKNRGLLVTLRLLYPERKEVASLDSLGYTPPQRKQINHMLRRRFGINIITGVTGSGKSTTLVACMDHKLRSENQELDLITIEEPIEYDIPGVGGMQTQLTFAANDPEARRTAWDENLRNCLRHAPDILMPGELRDGRGAVTAFNTALSGHAVWTTLHTFDVFSVVKRLIGMGVDPDLVTNPALLTGIINQSLVRVLCPHCKVLMKDHIDTIDEDLLERLRPRVRDLSEVYIVGAGCPHCRFTGVTGRELAAEVLVPNATLMQVYNRPDGGMLAARIFWVKEQNGMTKMAHAISKIAEGRVDPRHVEKDIDPLDTDEINLGIAPCL